MEELAVDDAVPVIDEPKEEVADEVLPLADVVEDEAALAL